MISFDRHQSIQNIMYPIVKHFHVILVICSVSFFQFRYWQYRVGQVKTTRLVKIAPHVIDTLLFSSGIALALMVGFSPLNSPWLLYKLLALLAYILFGMLAMKRTGTLQWLGYVMATLAVIYIIYAATQKVPWPQ